MAKIEAVIIRRSDEENTVALVSAECDPDRVGSTNDLFGAISRAVTRWAQQGPGKNKWNATMATSKWATSNSTRRTVSSSRS